MRCFFLRGAGGLWPGPCSPPQAGRGCEEGAVEPLVRGEAGSRGAELGAKLKVGFSGVGSLRADEDSLRDRKRG